MLDGGDQGWQCVVGDGRLGNEFQRLTTAGAEAEQLAQALGRHGGLAGFQHAHADLAVKLLGQLRQYLRRASVQAMGVGQLNLPGRPLGWQFAAQRFEHGAAVGGVAQLVATAFDQQQAQTLEQRLMRLTEAGQAEQSGQRLAQITHGFVGGDERQTRTLDGLLAVQPPEAIAQRQRFHLLEHGGKAVTHAVGLAQQACAAPDQFFKIVGRYAEADHLCVERQFLRSALQ